MKMCVPIGPLVPKPSIFSIVPCTLTSLARSYEGTIVLLVGTPAEDRVCAFIERAPTRLIASANNTNGIHDFQRRIMIFSRLRSGRHPAAIYVPAGGPTVGHAGSRSP